MKSILNAINSLSGSRGPSLQKDKNTGTSTWIQEKNIERKDEV